MEDTIYGSPVVLELDDGAGVDSEQRRESWRPSRICEDTLSPAEAGRLDEGTNIVSKLAIGDEVITEHWTLNDRTGFPCCTYATAIWP